MVTRAERDAQHAAERAAREAERAADRAAQEAERVAQEAEHAAEEAEREAERATHGSDRDKRPKGGTTSPTPPKPTTPPWTGATTKQGTTSGFNWMKIPVIVIGLAVVVAIFMFYVR